MQTQKKLSEDLDEEKLIKLVNEFVEEYDKLDSLTESQKEDIAEIKDLIELLQEIDNKVASELAEYKELAQLEEKEGRSIRDLVLDALMQSQNEANDNNNNNNNNNNTNNNSNSNETGASGLETKVDGIAFGMNKSEENASDIVNTLVTKSNNNKKSVLKKRSFEEAGLVDNDTELLPAEKKAKSMFRLFVCFI